MKVLWCFLAVLVLALQYRLWIGEGSFHHARLLQDKVDSQQQENALLASRNGRLDAEVLDLQRGRDAIEERARMDWGMIAKNETFYLVLNKHD